MNNQTLSDTITTATQPLHWCLADEEFRILSASALFPGTEEKLIGQYIYTIPGFPSLELLNECLRNSEEYRFKVYPTPYGPVECSIKAICTADGTRMYMITQERQQNSADLQRVSEILSNVRSGIFLLDADGKLLLSNNEGRNLLDVYSVSDYMHGNPYFIDLLPPYRKDNFRVMLQKAKDGETQEYEARYESATGEPLWLLINLVPERDENNNIKGICITTYDITRRKLDEDAFLRSEQRWKFALDGTGDGLWEYNFQTDEVFYSPVYKKMLGYSEDEFRNVPFEWKTRIHPADIHKIQEIDHQYVSGLIESHAIEYRLKHRNGDYLWILDRGMLMGRDGEGRPGTLIGTHKNITERKHAEQKLKEFTQRFSSFMSNTPSMCWIVDEYNQFRYMNERFKKFFNFTDKALGLSIHDLYIQEIADEFTRNNQRVFATNESIEVTERTIAADGTEQFYHVVKFPLESENGVRMLGGVALDVTQRKILEDKLAAEEEQKKREIIQAIMNAQEEERKELAYELHDNVNQILTSAKLMMEISMEKVDGAQPFVKRSLDYLQEAIREIRKLSHNLTPGTLRDISLEAAIDELVQNLNGAGKLTISFERQIAVEEANLKADMQVSLLRIAQEQLSNILNHSEASKATITLTVTPVKVALTIADNGRGFEPDNVKKGLGLNNIFNRTQYYKGKVELESSPGNGCQMYVEIPIAQEENL